ETSSRRAGFISAGSLILALAACASPSAPSALDRELADLRQVTNPFNDFARAQTSGYTAQLTSCLSQPALGAQGVHYARPELIDGGVTLLEPEVLLYEPQWDGGLRLLGVEYIVPFTAWTGSAPPALLGQSFRRNEQFGVWALHVWLWRSNPSGMFADWNPSASCP
ncbi:MAG TPA: hypothetical protein VN923_02635, partial [Thermoanaerobaculia bacterium]|nr:hypothetical protein [Thermoanaerobaculia bacterium]